MSEPEYEDVYYTVIPSYVVSREMDDVEEEVREYLKYNSLGDIKPYNIKNTGLNITLKFEKNGLSMLETQIFLESILDKNLFVGGSFYVLQMSIWTRHDGPEDKEGTRVYSPVT